MLTANLSAGCYSPFRSERWHTVSIPLPKTAGRASETRSFRASAWSDTFLGRHASLSPSAGWIVYVLSLMGNLHRPLHNEGSSEAKRTRQAVMVLPMSAACELLIASADRGTKRLRTIDRKGKANGWGAML